MLVPLGGAPMGRRRFLAALVVPAAALTTARRVAARRSGALLGRPLMGTVVEIEAYHPDAPAARRAIEAAFKRIADIARRMTVFAEDSEIGHVNQGESKPVRVSADTFSVLSAARAFAALTGGAFDVTVLPLMRLWAACTARGTVPARWELDSTLDAVGFGQVGLDQGDHSVRLAHPQAGVDLGGIAKGYGVDAAVEALRSQGVEGGVVDAGGDLRVMGRGPGGPGYTIGLRHPRRPASLLAAIRLTDQAAATSGNYFRYFTVGQHRYGHVLDPRRGTPAETALSATVVAGTATRADALATATFVAARPDVLAVVQRAGAEGVLVTGRRGRTDGLIVHITPGLAGRVELLDPRAVLVR